MPREDDERLADAWLACALGRGISHEEHVRIAFVVLRRYGSREGVRRLVDGTRRNCDVLGAADRFDDALTRRWAHALADAVDAGDARDVDEFLARRPEFRRSDLYGLPAWKLGPTGPTTRTGSACSSGPRATT